VAPLCLAAVLVACAEPPTREINQAQGAFDAARAAGAETYAKTEFQAADAALKHAHDSVAERDYRGALSFALEAREQARAAVREAAAARARAATEVSQDIQTVGRAIAAAHTRLAGPAAPRDARARLAPALADLDAQLQEARSATAAGDYGRAAERVRWLQARLAELMPEPAPRRR
jgi:predicted S18 family serine protease